MPGYNAAIVVPPQYTHADCFNEIGLGLSSALKELGIHDPNGRNIVLGAHLAEGLPDDAIIWNLEQIMVSSPWLTQKYVDLMKKHTVFDYSYQNIYELDKLGIKAHYLGIGYNKALERIEPTEETTDVIFYGSINDRRKKILDELATKCSVGIAPGYGEQRDSWIAKGKIILCMHYYSSKVWELVRCSYLLANKKFIVSEYGSDKPLEEEYYSGTAFCDYNSIVQTCLSYLRDEQARKNIAQKGYDIFRKYPQTEYLKIALANL